jgi:hypothetical protein
VIRVETLFSSLPQIEDLKDCDVSSCYRPCDDEPLDIEVLRRQASDLWRDRRVDNDGDCKAAEIHIQH